MSDRTTLLREFAKAFAKKAVNILATLAAILAGGTAVIVVLYAITEFATIILNVTPLRDTELNHLTVTGYLIVGLVALLWIAHSAWEEAKANAEVGDA